MGAIGWVVKHRSHNEWEVIAAWDWVQIGRSVTLHHLAALDDRAQTERDWNGPGQVSCGRRGNLWIPGLISRMGSTRCRQCCAATGFPVGKGSPKNDDACRRLVEAELRGAA